MATMITTATTDSTTPKKASTCHPPSAQVNARHESHPDAPSQPRMMSRSHPEVANPHQPRTTSSTKRAANPTDDAVNRRFAF